MSLHDFSHLRYMLSIINAEEMVKKTFKVQVPSWRSATLECVVTVNKMGWALSVL